MSHREAILQLGGDPEGLERRYRQACHDGEADEFAAAVRELHAEHPDQLLFGAWHHRLRQAEASSQSRTIAWALAVPLGLLNALALWLISDYKRFSIQITEPISGRELDLLPTVVLLAAPISAVAISLFVSALGQRRWNRIIAIAVGLVVAVGYVLLVFPQTGPRVFQEQYLMLMVMQLAIVAWSAVAVVVLGGRGDVEGRFAFLHKSLEAFVVGGLFAIAGGLFTGITFGLFQALGIEPPEWAIRLFVAGGAGLIAVLSVAVVYDPRVEPSRQAFDEGLSKLIALLMRLMLPAALVVLVVYLAFIPFRFREPFENRDVLVIYNGMLFAIIVLLLGATPMSARDLGRRTQAWLRRGIVLLAALAFVVSAYALAAILYRTAVDRLTPNRLTFIGWNVVNMGILAWLVIQQLRSERARWIPALQRTFAAGTVLYLTWALATIVFIPWLFGIDQGDVASLPASVQSIVYDEPYPVLLKCGMSPHIYLLERGEKRWIKDIATFDELGYQWHDVRMVDCSAIDAVPDGAPIPLDAGIAPTLTPGVAASTATPLPFSYPAP